MRRREFITVLGGAALGPAVVRSRPLLAQLTDRMRRIGVLIPSYAESDAQAQTEVSAFREKLQQLGWADGRGARIDVRLGPARSAKFKPAQRNLSRSSPTSILSRTTPTTAALLKETSTVPIVFVNVSDPIGSGFAASMARPGGNATGFTNVEASLGGKWGEVLREINPAITRIAVLYSPKTSAEAGAFYLRLIQEAARKVGVEIVATPADDATEIEQALAALPRTSD